MFINKKDWFEFEVIVWVKVEDEVDEVDDEEREVGDDVESIWDFWDWWIVR